MADVVAAPLPPLVFRPLPSGDEVVSIKSDLYFRTDRAELTGNAREHLGEHLVARVKDFLRSPGTKVAVRGFADGVGEADYNLTLSTERAESVGAFLVDSGAHPNRLGTQGFGESFADDGVPDARMRRVDIVLSGADSG